MSRKGFCFKGPIIEVLTVPQWEAALGRLLSSAPQFIGVDCEWKPDTSKNADSPVELIQLSSDKVCIILYVRSLRLRHEIPDSLTQLLTTPGITKVTHSFDVSDKKKLSAINLKVEPVADIATMAVSVGFKRVSLKHLAFRLFGYKINKRLAMSDWSQYPLSPGQVRYAATDAFLHQLIYTKLCGIISRNETVLVHNPKRFPFASNYSIPLEVYDLLCYQEEEIRRLNQLLL
jgi:ribonuclease D